MAITAETRTDIIELVVTTLNAAPGTTLLSELTAIIDGGGTLADIAANLTARADYLATYPSFQTNEEFAAEWLGNLVPEASAEVLAEGIAVAVGLLNGGASQADLMIEAQAFLSATSETDVSFGTSAANFNNKVEVATYHTVTKEQDGADLTALQAVIDDVTSDDATVTTANAAVNIADQVPGQTFTLTTDAESVNEGKTVYFTLATENVDAGTEYSYTITGVDAADVVGGALTGTATIDANGSAVIAVSLVADVTTEGAETISLAVAGETASVSVNDSSTTPVTTVQSFTLDTGADSLTSGASDDTYDASLNSAGNQTLNSLDSIDAGEGTDTLNVQLTASASPLSLKGIEKINLTASGAATLDLRNADSVTDLNVLGSTANTTVNNVPVGANLSISDTANDVTIGSKGASGSADAASVTLASVTGGANVTLAGIENIAINTISDSSIDLIATSLKELTLTGDSALTLGNLNTAGTTRVYSVDGSGSTGKVTLTTGNLTGVAPSQDVTITGGTAGDDFDVALHTTSDLNVSGGAGNDRITAAPGAGDTLAGGDGTDTLELTSAVAAVNANITGFEALELTGNVSQDGDNIAGNEIASVTIKATGNAGLTDAPSSVSTLVLNSAAIGNNVGTITLDRKSDTADDSATIVAAGATSATVTVNDEESLTVTSGIAASEITTLNAADVTSLTITGTEDLTIGTLAGNVSLAVINAEGSTGAISVGDTANGSLVPMTITAGSGGLTVDGSGRDDTITGGAGIDFVDAGDGNDIVTGGAGNDNLDGEAGNDSLVGGEGNDTIIVGAGIDTVDAGAGTDTITLSTNYTTLDSIDGGDGTDTVTITTSAGTLVPVFANVERVTMTAQAGGANIVSLASSTSVDRVTVADGADVATTISSLGSGTVINGDTGNTLTVDTTAGATLQIQAAATNTNALTITDAASVTIVGAAANGAFNNTVLDAIDTTALTVISATAGADAATGAITGTDKLASLVASTAGTGGDLTIGDIADADSLTSVLVTASAGDVAVGELGGTGGAASGTAEALATVTATAAQAAEVTFDEIYADTTNSVVDNDMTITASANDAGSFVKFDDVTNTFGAVVANLSGTQEVSFTEGSGTITANSVEITRDGSGDTTIDAIDATTTMVVTNNSSGTLTITTSDAEGDTTVSTTSGALDVTTTSTDNVTLTGGAQDDQLIASGTTETGKTHTLSGLGGADTITGGGGNDVLLGGDGNDQITAGAGKDNIDGGEGTDTIIMGANLVSTDTIEGGGGTDTLTATMSANYSGAITGVEVFSLTFDEADSGTFSFENIDSEVLVIANGDADNDSVVLGSLASGTTVRIADANIITTVDTVADASVTVDVRSAVADTEETLTITDAASVTITSGTAVANGTANIVLDAVDTTALTVAATKGAALTTGAITGTNKLASLTVTSSVASGAPVVGTVADADSLTSVTLTASEADATIGQIGTDATANNAEILEEITVSASGSGVTATLGDVYLDSTVNSTTDNTVTLTVTAETAATSALGLIDNTYGTIVANYTAEGTITQTTLTGTAMTITSAGAGSNTISNLNATGAVVVTTTGSGTFEITNANVDGGSASLTVDGSGQTGTVDVIATNSSAAVNLTGGAGADTLTGGSGNDSLVGGAGNDRITLNGGFDTVDAGAGTDTIIVGGNISLTDSIDGGDGTDTVTAELDTATVHQFGTLTNVEVLTLDFTAAGTFKANNISAATVNVTVSDAAATAVDIDNLATGKTVDLEHDDINGVALDYVDTKDATATIRLSSSAAVDAGTLAVTDAQTVIIQSHGGANHALGAVTLDATDTDFLTVSTAAADSDLTQTGAFASDDVVTVSITAGHDNSSISLGAGSTFLATADKLTSLTISAEVEDDADVTITTLGGTAAAAALETISITASADATISGASGADVTTGIIDAAGADLTSITLAANYTGSVITVGAGGGDDILADSAAAITVSAVSGAEVDVQGGVDITTIGQISASGAGTIRFDNADNDTSTLERVDSTVTGTFIADFHQTTDVVTYTLGSGTNTITTGTANDVVYLKASAGTDDVNLSTSDTGTITIHNFQVGAAADDLGISILGIVTGTGATQFVNSDDATDVFANGDTVVITEYAAGGVDFDNADADANISVIDSDFATNAALISALSSDGTASDQLVFASAVVDGDAMLFLVDDGTDSRLVAIEFNDAGGGANFADNDSPVIADMVATTLVTFVGIADATTIVAGNFSDLVT